MRNSIVHLPRSMNCFGHLPRSVDLIAHLPRSVSLMCAGRVPRSAVRSLLSVVAFFPMLVSTARAETTAPAQVAPAGLAVGVAAPHFLLSVVNDAVDADGKKLARFGPERWTGLPPQPSGAPAVGQKKLVLLSFFATYCEPCKKEMPELSRIYDTYKDQGLGVMLVSIDKGDEQKQQIIDLAKTNAVKFPVMHDRFQIVARRYVAERLPYVLLLDGAGNVTTVHTGYTDDVKAALENEVRAGLGLAPLPPPAVVETPKVKPTTTKKKSKAGGSG